jgi:hypothetical protein
MASKISSMPIPSFALARITSEGFNQQRVFHLLFDALRLGSGQVNLVDDGHDCEILVVGEVRVGDGLRFHALRGVHYQYRALTRGEAARHLVGEVHMPRRVDEVQLVGLAVFGGVRQAHGGHLNRDAPLALQVHRVQHLLYRRSPLDCPRILQ